MILNNGNKLKLKYQYTKEICIGEEEYLPNEFLYLIKYYSGYYLWIYEYSIPHYKELNDTSFSKGKIRTIEDNLNINNKKIK